MTSSCASLLLQRLLLTMNASSLVSMSSTKALLFCSSRAMYARAEHQLTGLCEVGKGFTRSILKVKCMSKLNQLTYHCEVSKPLLRMVSTYSLKSLLLSLYQWLAGWLIFKMQK